MSILSLGTYPLPTPPPPGLEPRTPGCAPQFSLAILCAFLQDMQPHPTPACVVTLTAREKHINSGTSVSPHMCKSILDTFPSPWPQNRPFFGFSPCQSSYFQPQRRKTEIFWLLDITQLNNVHLFKNYFLTTFYVSDTCQGQGSPSADRSGFCTV